MTNLEALKAVHKIQRLLLKIRQSLDVQELKEPDMAVSPAVADIIAKFDTETTAIADRIQRLIDAGGLSADDKAAFQAEVDKLHALGQDPTNPVPGR